MHAFVIHACVSYMYVSYMYVSYMYVSYMQVETSLSECMKVWRGLYKKQATVVCHICKTYKAKNIAGLKYHWNKCGKVQSAGYRVQLCTFNYLLLGL